MVQRTPEKLNAFGAIDSDVVPWPTLFFGMFLIIYSFGVRTK